MSLWHADTDGAALNRGARVLVRSEHRVVRVITADQLSIETPDGARLGALVLDRTAGQMRLSLFDGESMSLSMLSDASLEQQPGAEFSHQVWVVN
jgi:hypothetical protein